MLPDTSIIVQQVDGSTQSIGRASVSLQIGNISHTIDFHIISRFRYPLLLGLDVGQRFKLTINLETRNVSMPTGCNATTNVTQYSSLHLTSDETTQLEAVLKRHESVFSDTDIGRIRIEED